MNFNNLTKIFDLHSELEDYDKVYDDIAKSIYFRGTNLWILMFAIVVASVGLNMNSTAVIIGAMLISPLMGPINGIGYSLATYDFVMLKRALKNLSYAVLVSLFTSTLYFIISPVNQAHSELLARTSPTIYDVLIALFGGLAGIVAISSKLKGNVIPGVAIATALMPPICTAGYGLATLQFNFFFGAFYLFTINTVFIAFASLMVCQFLRFPIRSAISQERKKHINRITSSIIAITAIPSIFFGYQLVQDERFNNNATDFVSKISVIDGNYLQKNNIDNQRKKIELMYSGYGLTPENITFIKQIAIETSIDSSRITISQGFEASMMEENKLKHKSETEVLNNKLNAMSFTLKKTENQIDSLANLPQLGQKLLTEIKAIYPQILSCAYTETFAYKMPSDSMYKTNKAPLVVLSANKNKLRTSDKAKIEEWLKKRLNDNNAYVCFHETTPVNVRKKK